ncbi:hypothetical protein D8674_018802 [Pyrus ussuriensis x Pyrus communis]|uniref:Integrase catalytic domain-containing protein n=1 Tax=Pyrus ussuriensis x Pyrus communis TaxID=2448454 RepID=A0A5N5GB68_9ROSA|nr:hypothetical protein D8674_018802 [Pyrus ussuriensis x Pyrus communis]
MAGAGGGELRAPIFNGNEKDEKELTAAEKLALKDNVTKDAKALGLIQNAVSDDIFPRIAQQVTSKAAWDILKSEFVGDKKVRSVKLQGLRREFEYLRMKDDDSLSGYVSKLFELETKDTDTISVQEVVGSLKSHEQRLQRHADYGSEKAFSSLSINPREGPSSSYGGSSKFKNNWKNKGKKMDVKSANVPKKENQASVVKNSSVWYVDSACSNHMTSHESLLIEVNRNMTAKVKMGTGDLVQAVGKGTLVINTIHGKRYIKEVMLVPGLDENLLSVGQMVEHGYFLVFGDYLVDIFEDKTLENLLARVQMTSNRCFPMTLEYGNEVARRATVEESTWNWHRRYGHLNFQSLKSLQQKEMVYGLPEIKDTSKVCEGCAMGKAHREVFDKEKAWRATIPLELIHTDVCGPMQVSTIGGNKYFLTFIDDYTRMCWHLPYNFWGEAVTTAVYILNQCPTRSLHEVTPFEAFSGRKPGVKHLRVFGSICYYHVPSQLRHKLKESATKGIFIGYGKCEKGYRVYDLHSKKVILSRSVIFDENLAWNWETQREMPISVPLNVEINDRITEQVESAPASDQIQSEDTTGTQDSSVRVQNSATPNSTTVRLRSLTDIYARCNMCIIEPENYQEAAKDKAWQATMDNEISMIEKNETWELVDISTSKPVIGVKWTFAPVARMDTIRTLIALAAQKGWRLFQLDVKSAFLNGTLHEEVYVDQPEGFVIQNAEEKVYKLRKALYGLKQAPRAWYEEIDAYLILCGFKRSLSEPTLYVKVRNDKFGLQNCKPVSTPLATNEKLCRNDGSESTDEGVYRQIVGSLLYLIATRPDIMFAALLLIRFMHSPSKKHLGTAKRVLRYIQGTIDFGIEFEKGKKAVLIGYCDSDWSGCEDDMKSTSGYAFTFGSGVFSWASMKQHSVALSTVEAEYVSAAEATTQAI